jgi:hypothetical protein
VRLNEGHQEWRAARTSSTLLLDLSALSGSEKKMLGVDTKAAQVEVDITSATIA